jgi:hypothetical protein
VRSVSITRRLILTVLVLEVFSAIALIGAITVHERHLELKAFDATLRGSADSIMGAIQDGVNDPEDLVLDMRGMRLPKDSAFRVEDERGKVIGAVGQVPEQIALSATSATTFRTFSCLAEIIVSSFAMAYEFSIQARQGERFGAR